MLLYSHIPVESGFLVAEAGPIQQILGLSCVCRTCGRAARAVSKAAVSTARETLCRTHLATRLRKVFARALL